ncbi:MAG: hypothetical protein ACRC57_01755 [Sarcina sp.]
MVNQPIVSQFSLHLPYLNTTLVMVNLISTHKKLQEFLNLNTTLVMVNPMQKYLNNRRNNRFKYNSCYG